MVKTDGMCRVHLRTPASGNLTVVWPDTGGIGQFYKISKVAEKSMANRNFYTISNKKSDWKFLG